MTKFNMVTASPAKTKGTPITPDSSFQKLVQDHGAEKISLCFQCRKCSSGCPMGFAMDYLPDVILRMVRLGMKDRVLNSDTIWVCASCETCTTRCPNEIDIAHVMDTLRQLSSKKGVKVSQKNSPIFHKAFLTNVKRLGRMHEISMAADFT